MMFLPYDQTPIRRLGRRLRIVAAAASFLIAGGSSAAFAQSIASSTLNGTVTDDTGGALPGVTVTLTSRASRRPADHRHRH
jgi:hypothetical protein